MAGSAAVQIVGLQALARDLKQMADPQAGALLKEMARAGRQAAEPVAAAVRNLYPIHSGQLAGSVRVTATRSGATVRVGRKNVPYAGPVDFGGYPGDRPYLPSGRYLYPTMARYQLDVIAAYEHAVNHAVDAFTWTNTGDVPHD